MYPLQTMAPEHQDRYEDAKTLLARLEGWREKWRSDKAAVVAGKQRAAVEALFESEAPPTNTQETVAEDAVEEQMQVESTGAATEPLEISASDEEAEVAEEIEPAAVRKPVPRKAKSTGTSKTRQIVESEDEVMEVDIEENRPAVNDSVRHPLTLHCVLSD